MPVNAAAGTIVGSAYAQTSFHGDAVADTAALTAIVASNRFDRQERTVESPLEQYVFDEQSAAASSPPDILVPDDSPATGRWIRLMPGGGVPASHAASHAEDASDEIFVENLGAISLVTTDTLMPDGAGGLVFGAPAPAAHALGGALHTADTLANLNSKVSDAVLVDGATIMLLDGTQAMTGTMTTQDIIPDGDGTRTSGSDAAAWLRVITRFVRPDIGQALILEDSAGVDTITIASGGNTTISGTGILIFSPSGNVIRVAAGRSFQLLDDVPLQFGAVPDAVMQWDTTQLNDHLILGVDSVTNIFLITDQDRIGTLDLGLAAATQPTLVLHDGSLTAANWFSLKHDGGNAVFTPNVGSFVFVGDIRPDVDGTRSLGSASFAYGTGWVRTLRPDAGQNLIILDPEGDEAIRVQSTLVTFNDPAQDRNLRVKGDTDPNLLFIDGGLDRVGVGVATAGHLGKLHVDQNDAAGAIPVLVLDQGDIDDTFINFIGTSAADGTRSISSDTTEDAAKVGAFRVELNGVTGWMRVFADES